MEDVKERILLVEDTPTTAEILQRTLSSRGFQVFTAPGVGEAIRILESVAIDLVVTDCRLPAGSGLDLVRHVRENYKDTEIMMITGYATVEGAVQAIKSGADEYLAKPFTDEELFAAVERSLSRLRGRRSSGITPSPALMSRFGLLGESRAMLKVFTAVTKAAATSATVILTGESGTGKEVAARAIVYAGKRASAPFVPVNCGGIPETLLESELFGYVKGAFTGAVETRAGFFQAAEGGTVFLDEISETSPSMQVKLLRLIEDKELTMVGDQKPRRIDVRIIAATNKSLVSLKDKGLLREDLFFRLNVINIPMPALRDRGDDVCLLARHFAAKFAREVGKLVPAITDAALRALREHDWPGNVRELEHLILQLVVMSENESIDLDDLPGHMQFAGRRETGFNRTLAQVGSEYAKNVLASLNGNKSKAAEILGIDRKTLREKLKTAQAAPQKKARI